MFFLQPIFLYRNLSYMKERMSRSHKSRRDFRIDTILDRIMAKNSLIKNPSVRGFMTLTFLGFYDKKSKFKNTLSPYFLIYLIN